MRRKCSTSAPRQGAWIDGLGFGGAAFRLAHGQPNEQRKQHAGCTKYEEGGPPAQALCDQTAQGRNPSATPACAPTTRDGKRRRPPLGGEVVRDYRVGSRNSGRLADAGRYTRDSQMNEAPRQARCRSGCTPQNDSDRDDHLSRPAVRPAGDGKAGHGVEEGKGHPAEETHGAVGQAQVPLDRLHEHAEDLPVEVVERVDHDQDTEHVSRAVSRAGVALPELMCLRSALHRFHYFLRRGGRADCDPVRRISTVTTAAEPRMPSLSHSRRVLHRRSGNG